MLIKKVEPEFSFFDDRGELTQLVSNGYMQVNVLHSKAGTVRGNHYHKQCTEAFYVIEGSVSVEVQDGDICEKEIFSKGDFFCVMPGIMHSLRFEENCTMVQLYDVPVEHNDGSKDIYAGG